MRAARTRQFVEVIGLVAVVASLLLVAYQIQQANRIARATTVYEIVRDVNQFNNMGVSDPTFASLLVKLASEDFAPSETEAKQAQLLAYRFLNIWIIQEVAYRNDLLAPDQLSITKSDVVNVIRDYPGLLHYFQVSMSAQPEFANYEVLQPFVE